MVKNRPIFSISNVKSNPAPDEIRVGATVGTWSVRDPGEVQTSLSIILVQRQEYSSSGTCNAPHPL